jgi:hypothetical protein
MWDPRNISRCVTEKRSETELPDKNLEKNVPKILSLLFLWWCINNLYIIGPRRVLRYIKNTAHIIVNTIVVLLCLKTAAWVIYKLHL